MLSREGFCKALRMIRDQESIDEKFSKALNLVGMVTLYSVPKTSIFWLLEMF